MISGREEVTVGRSADDVWSVIGDFANMEWFPGIDRLTVSDDRRVVYIQGIQGGSIEQLFARDDRDRSYSYGAVGLVDGVSATEIGIPGIGPYDLSGVIGHHKATLCVAPTGPAACRVTYEVELDHEDQSVLQNLAISYRMALDHLKANLG